MTFQAIDTQLILDSVNKFASVNGIDLSLKYHGKGVYKGQFGETIEGPDGSKIRPMLFLRNVNDGGHAFMVGVGLYRFVCTNGLVVGDSFYNQRIIHREGPKMQDFLMNLDDRLNNAFQMAAIDFTDAIVSLQSKELTDNQGLAIIGSLGLPQGIEQYSQHYWVNPQRIEDQPRNLWTLYNVVNEMNRRRSSAANVELTRELPLLQNIELLFDHEQYLVRKAA